MHGPSPARPTFVARIADAARRRARHWWRSLTVGPRPGAAESAWRRLLSDAADDGLCPACGASSICPGLTAAAIPTLRAFGEPQRAIAWGRKLPAWQKRDGALPDAGLLHASLFNTAQAVRAWNLLRADGLLPECAPALARACDYLISRIGDDGAIAVPAAGGSFDRWAPASVHLAGLAIAADHGRRGTPAERRRAVARAVEYVLRVEDPSHRGVPLHVAAHGLEALWELRDFDARCEAAARRGLESAAVRQRRDGSVSVDAAHDWVSSPGLAHLADLWLQAGMLEPARRALECLSSRLRRDGSWPGSWGRGATYFPRGSSSWTAKHFLDAVRRQVTASFAVVDPTLLAPPADDDRRAAAVDRLAARLPPGAELIDVGCGSGRYLARLAERFRGLRLSGVDPSAALLRHVPAGVAATTDDLLHLHLPNDRYDAAVCVEALEHALLPERAVDELCRIVKPGGRVLVIDKCRRFLALSHAEPWERWFAPDEVSRWLRRHCDHVECTALPLGPQQRTPGLFLAWEGVKRATAATVALRRAA